MTTEALIEDLAGRFDRVERAILGDETVGHVGLVTRIEILEDDHRSVPEKHQALEDKRVAGDRRAHERLDEHETATSHRLNRIEKKIDRYVWLTAGAFLGGVGVGSWADLGRIFAG